MATDRENAVSISGSQQSRSRKRAVTYDDASSHRGIHDGRKKQKMNKPGSSECNTKNDQTVYKRPKQNNASLMGLPRELRDMILTELLQSMSMQHTENLGILDVSRQLREEAADVIFRQPFRFHLHHRTRLEQTGGPIKLLDMRKHVKETEDGKANPHPHELVQYLEIDMVLDFDHAHIQLWDRPTDFVWKWLEFVEGVLAATKLSLIPRISIFDVVFMLGVRKFKHLKSLTLHLHGITDMFQGFPGSPMYATPGSTLQEWQDRLVGLTRNFEGPSGVIKAGPYSHDKLKAIMKFCLGEVFKRLKDTKIAEIIEVGLGVDEDTRQYINDRLF